MPLESWRVELAVGHRAPTRARFSRPIFLRHCPAVLLIRRPMEPQVLRLERRTQQAAEVAAAAEITPVLDTPEALADFPRVAVAVAAPQAARAELEAQAAMVR